MIKVEKYIINLFNSVQTSFTYRFQFFSGMFILIIPFLIKIYLWKCAYMANGFGEIKGYSYDEIIAYNTFSMLFAYLSTTYFQYNIAFEIKDGTLSRYLVKPINHMSYWMSILIGNKLINTIYVLILILIAGVFWGNNIEGYISLVTMSFTIIAVFFAVILNFLIFYAVSLLAFWFLDVSFFFAAISFVISILSGEIIPINVMPEIIENALLVLPFNYLVYFPVRILLGKLEVWSIVLGIVMQIVWIIVFVLVGRGIWRIGLKKYESVGG